MKSKIITFLIAFVLLSGTLAVGQAYQVNKLYAYPSHNAPVSFVFPSFFKVAIIDKESDWVLIQIKWNINILVFQNQGQTEGWLQIREVHIDVN